jgi:Family of unknown function (DUF6502)
MLSKRYASGCRQLVSLADSGLRRRSRIFQWESQLASVAATVCCAKGKISLVKNRALSDTEDLIMSVISSTLPEPESEPLSQPAAEADLLLARACEVMEPLARLLVAKGVGYTQLSQALKPVFMEAARAELQSVKGKETDAAISLLSGVHRKDVRSYEAMREELGPSKAPVPNRALSVAEQVYTRWTTDAAYRDEQGKAAHLRLLGQAPSFDSLVNAVSKDFSRRTVLDELLRLGLVEEAGDVIRPLAQGMAPTKGFTELTHYLATNVHDHLAAAAANVRAVSAGEKAPFLEHSMYANGLSEASIAQLLQLAKTLWQPAFGQMVDAARQRYAIDESNNQGGRMRFGVYFYSEGPEGNSVDKPK